MIDTDACCYGERRNAHSVVLSHTIRTNNSRVYMPYKTTTERIFTYNFSLTISRHVALAFTATACTSFRVWGTMHYRNHIELYSDNSSQWMAYARYSPIDWIIVIPIFLKLMPIPRHGNITSSQCAMWRCELYIQFETILKNIISEYRSTGLDMELFRSQFRRPDRVQGIFPGGGGTTTSHQFLNNLNSTQTSLLYHSN